VQVVRQQLLRCEELAVTGLCNVRGSQGDAAETATEIDTEAAPTLQQPP
jgi:hypothetical protein